MSSCESVNNTQNTSINNIKGDLTTLTNKVNGIKSCTCSGTSTTYDDTSLKNKITTLESLINNVSTYAHENACKCSGGGTTPTPEYTPVFLSLS